MRVSIDSMANIWLMSPVARIHVSGKHGMEVGSGPLTITPSTLPGECVFSVATTLGSGAVRVLVPVGEHVYSETL